MMMTATVQEILTVIVKWNFTEERIIQSKIQFPLKTEFKTPSVWLTVQKFTYAATPTSVQQGLH